MPTSPSSVVSRTSDVSRPVAGPPGVENVRSVGIVNRRCRHSTRSMVVMMTLLVSLPLSRCCWFRSPTLRTR